MRRYLKENPNVTTYYALHENNQVLRVWRANSWPDLKYHRYEVLVATGGSVFWETFNKRKKVTRVCRDANKMNWKAIYQGESGSIVGFGEKLIEPGIVYRGSMQGLLLVLADKPEFKRVLKILLDHYL